MNLRVRYKLFSLTFKRYITMKRQNSCEFYGFSFSPEGNFIKGALITLIMGLKFCLENYMRRIILGGSGIDGRIM
jgi:hypothetical protein